MKKGDKVALRKSDFLRVSFENVEYYSGDEFPVPFEEAYDAIELKRGQKEYLCEVSETGDLIVDTVVAEKETHYTPNESHKPFFIEYQFNSSVYTLRPAMWNARGFYPGRKVVVFRYGATPLVIERTTKSSWAIVGEFPFALQE